MSEAMGIQYSLRERMLPTIDEKEDEGGNHVGKFFCPVNILFICFVFVCSCQCLSFLFH